MTEIDIVSAQCKRVLELLETENIEYMEITKDGERWSSVNQNNTELRQRLKMLRKDTLLLERKLKRR